MANFATAEEIEAFSNRSVFAVVSIYISPFIPAAAHTRAVPPSGLAPRCCAALCLRKTKWLPNFFASLRVSQEAGLQVLQSKTRFFGSLEGRFRMLCSATALFLHKAMFSGRIPLSLTGQQ